tara:strand:+ start:8267 stop:9727 length:1461 start_codon:yes stop_codon:yes gene_type:complete
MNKIQSLKSKISCFIIVAILLMGNISFAQNFSPEVEKFISVDTTTVAIKNVTLIDGTGTSEKPNQTIIFTDGKITQLGNAADIEIPKNTLVLDGHNKTVMPGLVMVHEHMYISAHSLETRYANVRQLPVTFPRLYLAAGATTIRTAGNVESYSDLNIKRDIDNGRIPGPFMEVTAPYLEGNGSIFPQMNELKRPEDAETFVNYWADQGFTSFKGYMAIDKPTLKAAIDAVHKRHLKITAHLCAVTYREAAELGIDNLEHGFLASTDFSPNKKENECNVDSEIDIAQIDIVDPKVKNLLQFLIDKKVGVTSTLAVFEGFLSTQKAPSTEVLNAFSPDSRDYYLKQFANIKSSVGPTAFDKAYLNNAKMEKLFYDMGGLLTVGTDPTGNGGTLAGYGTWQAIELLVEADGFSPLEAIKIATLNGAKALGFEKTKGTIEIGKNADLLLIEGNPSKNISDIRNVEFVFKNGVGYNSKKLFESVKGKVGFN